jgi:hypothetical protein
VGYEVPDEWWLPETWVDYNGFQGWVDNPGDQAGRSLFNIASLLIPVKGGGAIAHGLDAVGDGARLADDAAEAAARGGTRLLDGVASVVRQGDDLGRVVDDVAGFGGRTADDLAGLQGARPLDDLGRTADDVPPPAHGAPDAPPRVADDVPPPRDPDQPTPPRDDPAPNPGDDVPPPDSTPPGDGPANPPQYPTGHLPEKGEPGSYGYDVNGDRLPYANHRPDYAPDQVQQVWDASRKAQLDDIALGISDDLPPSLPGPDQLWVKDIAGDWKIIEWRPGEPRTGLWDLGHLPTAKYSTLREQYLSHRITKEEFLDDFRNPDNYRVEDSIRNQSHIDE